MAVVFISPKHRQKMFFMGITASLVLFLLFISLWVFLSKPTGSSSQLVLNKPKVTINLNILESEQFKNLQHFQKIPLQFSYIALDGNGKTIKGYISATSEEEAAGMLKAQGLTAGELKEVGIGRDNPFVPYYQSAVPPLTNKINKATTVTTPKKK